MNAITWVSRDIRHEPGIVGSVWMRRRSALDGDADNIIIPLRQFWIDLSATQKGGGSDTCGYLGGSCEWGHLQQKWQEGDACQGEDAHQGRYQEQWSLAFFR